MNPSNTSYISLFNQDWFDTQITSLQTQITNNASSITTLNNYFGATTNFLLHNGTNKQYIEDTDIQTNTININKLIWYNFSDLQDYPNFNISNLVYILGNNTNIDYKGNAFINLNLYSNNDTVSNYGWIWQQNLSTRSSLVLASWMNNNWNEIVIFYDHNTPTNNYVKINSSGKYLIHPSSVFVAWWNDQYITRYTLFNVLNWTDNDGTILASNIKGYPSDDTKYLSGLGNWNSISFDYTNITNWPNPLDATYFIRGDGTSAKLNSFDFDTNIIPVTSIEIIGANNIIFWTSLAATIEGK